MPWSDGTWHESDIVPFDSRDRGLLLGDGVFDTALVLGGRMVWRQAHVDRLLAAGATLGFAIDASAIDRAIDAIVARTEHGSIRLTVTRGTGPRGLAPPDAAKPAILAAAGPWPSRVFFEPLDLHVTSIRRNDTSPSSRIKSLAYLDNVLGLREATTAGCRDALFFNTQGNIACTSAANIFALFGRRLTTPPLSDGVLDGIVRRMLLRGCDALGLEPVARSMSLDDLEAADAVFATNSLRLIMPVRAIGARPIGTASLSIITNYLVGLIRDETGVNLLDHMDARSSEALQR